MTLRSKMVASISAFCLVLALLIIGVWAAQSVKIEMGGSLTFDANDVNVKIEGSITGTSEPQTLDTLIFSANDGESSGDVETWKNKALTFGRNDDEVFDIVIAIKITNLSKENAVNVKILDNYQTIENVDKTITRDDGQYTAGSTYALPKSTTESESTTTFKITFSVADKNQPVSGVQFGYTIDLSDESYVAPDPVVSNNESLGTIEYTINDIDKTIDVVAKPKEGCLLLGYENLETNHVEYVNSVSHQLYNFAFELNDGSLSTSLSQEKLNELQSNFLLDNATLTEVLEYKSEILSIMGSSSKYTQNDLDFAENKFDEIENGVVNLQINYEADPNYRIIFINKDNIQEVTVSDYKYTYYSDANVAFIKQYIGESQIITLPTSFEFDSKIIKVIGVERTFDSVSGDTVFADKVTEITIPDSILILDISFAVNNTLNKITIQGTKQIGEYAFTQCSNLQNVDLGDNVINIGQSAFRECSALTQITIPTSIVSIGAYAFDSCSGLANVVFEDTEGWQVSVREDFSIDVINIDSENLKNTSTTAGYLKDNYLWYFWQKV